MGGLARRRQRRLRSARALKRLPVNRQVLLRRRLPSKPRGLKKTVCSQPLTQLGVACNSHDRVGDRIDVGWVEQQRGVAADLGNGADV